MAEKVKNMDAYTIDEAQEYMQKVYQLNNEYFLKNGVRKKAYVLTLGCQQNEADSEKIAGMAMEMGYDITNIPEESNLIIVNTCAVREHAEKREFSMIGRYKHWKEANPENILGVCGCMVSQDYRVEELKHKYPYVDVVFGTAYLHKFPEIIFNRLNGGRRSFEPQQSINTIVEGLPINRNSEYRAWVSIMYGCNNFCSYCVVPYVRGRERSRKKDCIIQEVKALVENGYKDITLLGQNVNSYGKDTGENCDFADLLSKLSEIPGEYKLRFMTSHPKDASDKLIDVMANSSHIAHHFHLPLQSGSDRLLKLMNRHYDLERYLHIVDYLREKIPDIAITTDLIVGFPGETEEDFNATLEIMKKVRFDMIYSFIFSPRKGTPAYLMENQISDEIKNERYNRLLEVQEIISKERNEECIGKVLDVLCDGPSKKNETIYSGRTDNQKIVLFQGLPNDIGKYVKVKIESAEANKLEGTIVR